MRNKIDLVSDEDYERLKEQVIQEVCKTLKLSIIELEELTDFQKLIQNKIKRLVGDVHGKAGKNKYVIFSSIVYPLHDSKTERFQ